ncbi:Uncharacterised protein [Enterobacter cloacae]|nr:Uncharacterised protein [Enterobacter cloacae]
MIGFSAVTRIGLRANASLSLPWLTLKLAMALSASSRLTLASNWMLCNRLSATSGSITFSSKLPDWPATAMAASLPITWAATIAVASGITGLTLPGMIEEPGCSASSSISPSPASGPEFIQRRSLASFIRVTARVFNWPDAATAVSCEPIRAKKSSPGRNANPVRSFSSWLKRSANRGWALIPVPTAVPPCANCCKAGSTLSMCTPACRTCCAQPPSTWLMRTGIASIRWVRPVFT